MRNRLINEITAFSFKNFIASNKICILKAQVGKSSGFGKVLRLQLESEFKDEINMGWIDIQKVNYQSKAILEFIKSSMPNIGLKTSNAIFPGYYLFKNGDLKAYHPGTLDPNKIDPRVHGIAALFGALAGIIVGVAEKNTAKGFDVFFEAMEGPVAIKVVSFFKEILGASSSSYSQQRQHNVYQEELLNAYSFLKVSPSASDAEIKKAWKNLQLKNHPDLHPHDVESKTKYCVELNNAYELIKKHRSANN